MAYGKITVAEILSNGSDDLTLNAADGQDVVIEHNGTAIGTFSSTGLTIPGNLTVTGTTTTVDTVTMNAANAVVFEGATADDFETTLSIVDPTADRTQYLINQGGYVPVLAAVTTTAITSTPEELNLLDGVSGLVQADFTKLAAVDATAAELNIMDAGTTQASVTLVAADGVVINDASDVMKQCLVSDIATYVAANMGAATVTSLSVSDGNITNVGDINCDSISVDDAAVGLDIQFGGATTTNKISMEDNLGDALNINQGGTSYLKFVTTNSSEAIVAAKDVVMSSDFYMGAIGADNSVKFSQTGGTLTIAIHDGSSYVTKFTLGE